MWVEALKGIEVKWRGSRARAIDMSPGSALIIRKPFAIKEREKREKFYIKISKRKRREQIK